MEMIKVAQAYLDDHDLCDDLVTNLETLETVTQTCIGRLERPDIDFEIKICQKIASSNRVSD